MTVWGPGPVTARGDTPYAAVDQLGRVLVEVENEYVDPVDRARLVNGAIKGMVAELDPHSSYMTPEEFSAFESDTEGQFGGIGVEVELRGEQLVLLRQFLQQLSVGTGQSRQGPPPGIQGRGSETVERYDQPDPDGIAQ